MSELNWLTEGRAAAVLLFFAGLVVLSGQMNLDLFTMDDLREAEVAREMLETGDYVVPHLAGLPFVEKPPGFQIVLAGAFRVAGVRDPVARMVAAAFALATLAAVFLLGRRALGLVGGGIAALTLSLAAVFCRTAHEVLLDNALTAAVAWTTCFAWMALDTEEAARKRRFYALAGLTLGISFLMKGFVGPAIFGSGFLAWLIVSRRWGELKFVFHPIPVVAFLVPVLSWVIPFLRHAERQEVHEFFIENHLGRALDGWASHSRPFYYYVYTIWWKFLPGSVLLPFALCAAWQGRKNPEHRYGPFCLAMAVGGVTILSLSKAKDSVYLLPVYPVLALLVAGWCVRTYRAPGKPALGFSVACALASLATLGVFVGISYRLGGLSPGLILAGLGGLAAIIVMGAALKSRHVEAGGLSTAAVLTLSAVLILAGPTADWYVARDSVRGSIDLALSMAGDRELLLYLPDDQRRGGCGFVRRRTAKEVDDPAKLVDQLRREPQTVALIPFVLYRVPGELESAAAAAGVELIVEKPLIGYLETKTLGLIRAAPR